jgi:hypothetical protein
MVVTLWALWHARWKIIHEYINQSQVATHQFVEVFLQNLGECDDKKAKPTLARTAIVDSVRRRRENARSMLMGQL